jgi:hypothetical protein
MESTKRRVLTIAGAIAMLALPAIVSGQTAAINRPDLKVGDKWKVERRDLRTKALIFSEETVVTSVSPEKIEVSINDSPGSMSPNLTILDGPRLAYDTGYEFVRFPLDVGKKWDFKTRWHNKQAGADGTTQADVTVKSVESVKVSAGEFDAYKLEANGYMNLDSGGGRRISFTYWYAPKAKAIVRMEFVDRRDDFVSELVELSFAP